MCPYLQFPTLDNLKVQPKDLELGRGADATVLKRNMFKVMCKNAQKISEAFGGNAAHHVVEGNDNQARDSRAILKKFNIDINAPENGIFLPTDSESIYKGVHHKCGHSKGYSQFIYSKIKDVTDREELVVRLHDIKHCLYNGKIDLKSGFNDSNSNINH